MQPSDKSTSAIGKSQDLDLAVDNRASADTLPSAKTSDIIPQNEGIDKATQGRTQKQEAKKTLSEVEI